jgi:argininosuccinate lyase
MSKHGNDKNSGKNKNAPKNNADKLRDGRKKKNKHSQVLRELLTFNDGLYNKIYDKNLNPDMTMGSLIHRTPEEVPLGYAEEIRPMDTVDRILKLEIEVRLRHYDRLFHSGMLSQDEKQALLLGMHKYARGKLYDQPDLIPSDTSVSEYLDNILEENSGEIASMLNFGNSRSAIFNLFVGTEVSLALRSQMAQLLYLKSAFLDRAEEAGMNIMVGYSHLQRTRPTLIAHHLLGYFEMISRDVNRYEFLIKSDSLYKSIRRYNFYDSTYVPMWSGENPPDVKNGPKINNSVDSLSSFDYLLTYLSFGAILATNLSRLAEELCIWCSSEFSYISFPDALTTTSSMMPQKKNPDGAELLRGKSAVLIGGLTNALSIMKGQVLGSNFDYQELFVPLRDSMKTLRQMLSLSIVLVRGMIFNYEKMAKNAEDPTLIGPLLVKRLIDKRSLTPLFAFQRVSKFITKLKTKKLDLSQVTVSDLTEFFPKADLSLLKGLSPMDQILALDSIPGEAGPENVKKYLNYARATFQKESAYWLGESEINKDYYDADDKHLDHLDNMFLDQYSDASPT